MTGDLYINSASRSSMKTKSTVSLVLGLVFGPPLLLMFVLGSIYAAGEDPKLIGMFAAFFLLPAIAAFVAVRFGIRGLTMLSAARKADPILARDPDGETEMDSILEELGKKKGSSYEKALVRAADASLFRNLNYSVSDRVFYLSDNAGRFNSGFIGMSCPSCGAPVKVRAHSSVNCEVCGAKVFADRKLP